MAVILLAVGCGGDDYPKARQSTLGVLAEVRQALEGLKRDLPSDRVDDLGLGAYADREIWPLLEEVEQEMDEATVLLRDPQAYETLYSREVTGLLIGQIVGQPNEWDRRISNLRRDLEVARRQLEEIADLRNYISKAYDEGASEATLTEIGQVDEELGDLRALYAEEDAITSEGTIAVRHAPENIRRSLESERDAGGLPSVDDVALDIERAIDDAEERVEALYPSGARP
jgi:hypothetical protein